MSRYGNVKAGAYTKMNLESSSDTDLENLNDIEKVLGKIGIRIRSTNTEFRSFSDVLDELSDRWINLDNVSKNAIATAMAGVRQREQFLVLMENMDRAEELEEVSAHSQGTAESKYAAYMETIQSASNRLQSAWENLAMTLEQSGLVKLFTDLSVVLMKILLPSIRAVGTRILPAATECCDGTENCKQIFRRFSSHLSLFKSVFSTRLRCYPDEKFLGADKDEVGLVSVLESVEVGFSALPGLGHSELDTPFCSTGIKGDRPLPL